MADTVSPSSTIPNSDRHAHLKMTDATQNAGPSGSSQKPALQLPSMSTVDAVMTKLVKDKIKDSIEEPEMDSGLPHTVKQMSRHTICLPKLWWNFAEALRKKLEEILIDSDMRDDLEGSLIINWCRTVKKLCPMRIAGDGNCLLHAVSKAMWGIHDNTLLRRLVYIALVEDDKQFIRKRWECERKKLDAKIPDGGLELTAEEWDTEWALVVKAAEDVKRKGNSPGDELPFECLEEVHIFVLANVLMRPIIVLAETVIRNLEGSALGINNFPGLYLPLLWNAEDCIKTPLILGYSMNHFSPLIGAEDIESGNAAASLDEHALPLVNHRLEPLHVHFSLEDEENNTSETLQQYLDITEITIMRSDSPEVVSAARLNYLKVDDSMDIVNRFFRVCEQLYLEYMEKCAKLEPVKVKCHTEGCKRFGKAELQFFCPRCYVRNASESESDQSNGNNEGGQDTGEPTHNENTSQSTTSVTPTEPRSRHHQPEASGASVMSYDNIGEGAAAAAASPVAAGRVRTSSLQGPVLSMIEEQCSYPGCDNHCAITTKPYCHEHVFLASIQHHNPNECRYQGCHERMSATCKPYCQTHRLPTNEDDDNNGLESSMTESRCAHDDCHNMTSRFTHPYCHEHKQPAASTTGDFCAKMGCANFQSASAKPYCHEHKDSESRRTGSSATGSSEQSEPEPRARYEDMLPVFMAFICAIPSCDKKVTVDTDMYCKEHYIEKYGELPQPSSLSANSSAEDLPLPTRRPRRYSSSSESSSGSADTGDRRQSQTEAQPQPRSLETSKGLTGRTNRCQEPGCTLTGIAAWNYYCSQHRALHETSNRQANTQDESSSSTEKASSPEEVSTRRSRREAASGSRSERVPRNENSSPSGLRVPPVSRPDRSPASLSDDTSPSRRRFSSGNRYESSLHSRNDYNFPDLSPRPTERRAPLYQSRYTTGTSPRDYTSSRYDSGSSRYGRSNYNTRANSTSPTRSVSPKPAPPSSSEKASKTSTNKTEEVSEKPAQQSVKSDKPMSKLDKTRELFRIGLCNKIGCKNPAESRFSGYCKSCGEHNQFLKLDAKKEEAVTAAAAAKPAVVQKPKTEEVVPVVNKEPCKTNGCRLVGSPEFDGYCYQCQDIRTRIQQQPKQTKPVAPQVNGYGSRGQAVAQAPPKPAQPKAKVSSKPAYKPILQCKTNGCLKIAEDECDNYCPKCFAKISKGEAVGATTNSTATSLATAPVQMAGAFGGARPKESGQARSHERSETNSSAPLSLKTDTELLESRRQANGQHPTVISSATGAEDSAKPKKRCAGPGCNRVAYDAFNGMCQLCHNKPSTRNGTRAASSNGTKVSSSNGTRAPPRTEIEPTENSLPGAQECKTDGCDMFGTEAQMGYCSTCYKKNKAKTDQGPADTKKKSRKVAKQNHVHASPSQLTAGAKPCKNIKCDRFGDINLLGYCYRCSQILQAAEIKSSTNRISRVVSPKHVPAKDAPTLYNIPPVNGTTPGDVEAFLEVNRSSPISYGCCKTTGCVNMGSSQCNGLCDTCFHYAR